MITVKLKKPIQAHGETVDHLDLEEPITKDIIEIGMPTLIIPGDGEEVGIEIRQKVIAKYVSKLAKIPKTSVESLSLADFSACTKAVMGFFGMGDGEGEQ